LKIDSVSNAISCDKLTTDWFHNLIFVFCLFGYISEMMLCYKNSVSRLAGLDRLTKLMMAPLSDWTLEHSSPIDGISRMKAQNTPSNDLRWVWMVRSWKMRGLLHRWRVSLAVFVGKDLPCFLDMLSKWICFCINNSPCQYDHNIRLNEAVDCNLGWKYSSGKFAPEYKIL
jgi:hypothetical protein